MAKRLCTAGTAVSELRPGRWGQQGHMSGGLHARGACRRPRKEGNLDEEKQEILKTRTGHPHNG